MAFRLLPLPRQIVRTGDPSPASSVFTYVVRMSGWHQGIVCLLALIVAGLTMAPLDLQRRIVNDAISVGELDLLFLLCGIYLAVVCVAALLKFVLRLYQSWLSESAVRYSRAHLADIHECRLATRGEQEDGRAVSIIGNEVDKLGGFVGEGFVEPTVNVGMLLAIGGYMIAVEPLVALVALAFLLPQVILAPIVQRRLNRLTERRVGLVRQLSDKVAALGDGNGLECQDDLTSLYNNRMRIAATKYFLKITINYLNNLAPVAVFLFGGYLVIEGQTTVGVIVAFASGVQQLAEPVRDLLNYVRAAARAGVQHEMIARWM